MEVRRTPYPFAAGRLQRHCLNQDYLDSSIFRIEFHQHNLKIRRITVQTVTLQSPSSSAPPGCTRPMRCARLNSRSVIEMSEQLSSNRVVVAMSGGVDSSVAAMLLCREGWDVIGVTLKLYSLDESELPDDHQGCCTLDDVEDARTVCRRLGIPHYVLNMEREFHDQVMDYFVAEYRRGRTPHPCIACNDKIKFSQLMARADALGARYVATGHYARIDRRPGGAVLRKGSDQGKDQSYVLFGMTQDQLSRTLLPIGGYHKDEIRQLALESGLITADKPDSQDICFIPLGDYREFLRQRTEGVPGEIVELDGSVVGEHQGIEYFTVGQRRGLGLPKTAGEPRFVVRLEADTNRVVVGPESALYADETWVSGVNYISGEWPAEGMSVSLKIRYKSFEAPATLHPRPGGSIVRFREPQRAVTPGQAAVFYDGDVLIGGGTIEPPETAPTADLAVAATAQR